MEHERGSEEAGEPLVAGSWKGVMAALSPLVCVLFALPCCLGPCEISFARLPERISRCVDAQQLETGFATANCLNSGMIEKLLQLCLCPFGGGGEEGVDRDHNGKLLP